MQTSEEIKDLAQALARAQMKFKAAVKDSKAYGYSYADMSTVRDSVIEALSSEGLSVVQLPIASDNTIGIVTRLIHQSGQWIEGSYSLPLTEPQKGNTFPQMIGSCITYYRRYALMAILGLAPEDDDGQGGGNYTVTPSKHKDHNTRKPMPPSGAQMRAIANIAKNKGIDAPQVTTIKEASEWIAKNNK